MSNRDVLDRLIEHHGEYAEGDNQLGIDLADAIREIDRLREATRWRSVAEDGYPPRYTDVAVYGDRECGVASLSDNNVWKNPVDGVEYFGNPPTHWMSLPDPPK